MSDIIKDLEYEAQLLKKQIYNIETHIDELEAIIASSSEPLVLKNAETRILKLLKKEASLNRMFTEKAIAAFLARKNQAVQSDVVLDESQLPSEDYDDDSEGTSECFGFHKTRTDYEYRF